MGFLIYRCHDTARTPVFGAFLGAGSLRAVASDAILPFATERTAANTSTTSSTLTGRKFEMCVMIGSPLGLRIVELFVGVSFKMGRADEVVNHLDFPINPEQFQRVAFVALRYSRNSIGFVDGVGNDRFKCGVFPEQGDVRSYSV